MSEKHQETRALDTAKYKPRLWRRCVDDTFIIWTDGKDKLRDFLSHPNSIHPKIKFSMEIENRNQLPFIDVLVIKKWDETVPSIGWCTERQLIPTATLMGNRTTIPDSYKKWRKP
ncbi:hypothetical protein Trydic_g885 [Trypoxylus dichotomus]